MSDWTTLAELKPGTIFEAESGARGVKRNSGPGP